MLAPPPSPLLLTSQLVEEVAIKETLTELDDLLVLLSHTDENEIRFLGVQQLSNAESASFCPPPPIPPMAPPFQVVFQETMITTMMGVIIVIIILVLLMILVLKMTKKYQIT